MPQLSPGDSQRAVTSTCLQQPGLPCPAGQGWAEPAVLTVAALAIRPQLVARVAGALEGAPGVEALVSTHGQPCQALVHIWEREKP